MDVIQLLDRASDKQWALATYLNKCYQEIHKGEMASIYLKQMIGITKIEMDACIIDKNISDRMYFEAIHMYDKNIMETSLAESIHYEQCISTQRIQHNAKTIIANKLGGYIWRLQTKYDTLYKNQDILAENFEIFRDNILPELNRIDQLLKQYNF